LPGNENAKSPPPSIIKVIDALSDTLREKVYVDFEEVENSLTTLASALCEG
jgi:hypothetical protein